MARPTTGDLPSGPPLMPYPPTPNGLAVPQASPFGFGGAAPGPSAAAKNTPTLPAMLHALRRRWVLATFIGTLVAGVAALGVWVVLPTGKHTAKVVLKISPPGADVVHRNAEDMDGYRRTQMFLLKSRDLINRTLADPAVASLPSIRDVEDPSKAVEDNLLISVPAPDILLSSLTGDHPDDMKVILKTMAEKFVAESSAEDRRLRDERLAKLEMTYDKFNRELKTMEAAIRRMVEIQGGGTPDTVKPTIDVMQQHITETRLANEKMNTELIALAAKIALKAKQIKAAGSGQAIELDPDEVKMRLLLHPRVGKLTRDLEQATLRLAEDEKNAADKNAPTIVRLQNEVTRLTAELRDATNAAQPAVEKELQQDTLRRVRGELANLEIEYQVLKETHAARVAYVNSLQNDAKSKQVGQFDQLQLMKELDPQREYMNKIKAQIVQLQAEKEQGSRISIREGPFVSLNQNLQKKTMMATAAGLGSFAAVLILIGFLEWRTRRIDGVDQVVNDLSMRIIGTIPAFPTKASLKAADRHGAANWRFVLNESINSTRTMLLHAARNNSMQVVMVTSATQGEGKTSLASQLATSMATAGMRTLIVDCDLRNPSMHKLFDVQLIPGTCEVLLQDVDASEAVQLTSVPNLWMLPAGRCSNSTIAALAQGHPLETLFNRLRGQFDFIIVDCCPVLPVADALLIGQHVDGVVFSIMQDISQLPKVMVASERLQQLNITLLGAVVNGIRNDVYSYGYNYVKQLPA